jgi:hypothetical protein
MADKQNVNEYILSIYHLSNFFVFEEFLKRTDKMLTREIKKQSSTFNFLFLLLPFEWAICIFCLHRQQSGAVLAHCPFCLHLFSRANTTARRAMGIFWYNLLYLARIQKKMNFKLLNFRQVTNL